MMYFKRKPMETHAEMCFRYKKYSNGTSLLKTLTDTCCGFFKRGDVYYYEKIPCYDFYKYLNEYQQFGEKQ
jgi:hypothetical protein